MAAGGFVITKPAQHFGANLALQSPLLLGRRVVVKIVVLLARPAPSNITGNGCAEHLAFSFTQRGKAVIGQLLEVIKLLVNPIRRSCLLTLGERVTQVSGIEAFFDCQMDHQRK